MNQRKMPLYEYLEGDLGLPWSLLLLGSLLQGISNAGKEGKVWPESSGYPTFTLQHIASLNCITPCHCIPCISYGPTCSFVTFCSWLSRSRTPIYRDIMKFPPEEWLLFLLLQQPDSHPWHSHRLLLLYGLGHSLVISSTFPTQISRD
jgi:hypothetical protein